VAIADVYVREFHRQTRFYYSHWMPNSPLKLGDVGILEDGCHLRPRTTFADLHSRSRVTIRRYGFTGSDGNSPES